jgi:hypothetical protein
MGGLLGFVIGRHLQDQHNADLNAQKNILDMYSNVLTDPSHADPEVNRQALANYVDLLRKKPGDFRNPKMMDRVKGDLENWTEMNQAAKGRQPAPSAPPTQSLASQGPPSAQAPQVPPPPDAGGNNYGQFAGGPPSAVMGQMVAPSQPASQAMSAIAPPPESMSVPPPPGMEAPPQAAAAAKTPLSADALAYNPTRRQAAIDAVKFGAQYGAQQSAMEKAKEGELAFATRATRAEIDQRIADLKADKDEKGQSAWDKLTPRQRSEIRIGAKQITPELRPMAIAGSVPNSEILKVDPEANINGVPLDPTGYSRQRLGPLGMEYSPGLPPVMGVGTNAQGGRELFNNRGPAGAIPGIVAPNMATPHQETGPAGNVFFQNAAGGLSGANIPGAVNPAMLPSTSTTSIPGQLPQTTTRIKGTGAAGAGSVTRGNAQETKGPGIPDNSLIGRKYQDWVGGGPAPTGKELTAVQAYAANKNLPSPVQLSAAGQANLQSVDAVFREIDDADRILNQMKGDPSLRTDYLKYKMGFHTANDELFTKLSFEGLRSAAAAMKGNNSRAYPIIQRAFEHVPNLDRAGGLMPDQIPLIKDKLKAMRDVLTDTRNTVLQDERKSGVVGNVSPPPSSASAYKVGDSVMYQGRQHKITDIKDGKLVLEP